MSISIVACGDTGITLKAGNMLAELLDEAVVIDGKSKDALNLISNCDTTIIGTNVHFGKFNKHFLKLVKKIRSKRLFIYICGAEIERKDHYIKRMRDLVPSAEEVVYVWGELNSKGAPFFKRFAIDSFISGRKKDGLPSPRILDKEIRALARMIKSQAKGEGKV